MGIQLPAQANVQVIETTVGPVWLDADGILRTKAIQGVYGTLKDAEEQVAAAKTFGQGQTLPILVDVSDMRGADRAFREYLTGEETAKTVSACALLIGSATSRILGNFFLGLNKPQLPVQLFTDETEALKWLTTFLA